MPNILLSGGFAQFPGFSERLMKGIKRIQSKYDNSVKVVENPDYSAWLGASIFAYGDDFSTFAVSRKLYQEEGPNSISDTFF